MGMTNEQTCEYEPKHSHESSKQKGKRKIFQSEETNIPLQVFGLNTNYFLSSL